MTETALLLERLGALFHQAVRDDAARHGLLPVHLQILAYLARANRYSDLPIAIADYLGLTRGTVSQSLAVLDRRSLIARHSDPRHGRRVHIRLTPAGEATLADSWAHRADAALAAAHLAGDLAPALRAAITALQRLNGQRAFGLCRTCDHFLREPTGARCGLTHEPLSDDDAARLCREWTAPPPAHASR